MNKARAIEAPTYNKIWQLAQESMGDEARYLDDKNVDEGSQITKSPDFSCTTQHYCKIVPTQSTQRQHYI